MKRKVALLGSTGSIGRQTLDVIRGHSGIIEIYSLSAGKNVELLIEQIKEFRPKKVCISDEKYIPMIKSKALYDIEVKTGDNGLEELAKDNDVDIVVNALVGGIGLISSICALENGKRLCLANKESLVAGGKLVMEALKKGNGELIPIDSEHSAIFQSIRGGAYNEIKRLIITASGGPFWWRDDDLSKVDKNDVLNHPVWDMGNKITVDSATMVNKGFEVIEAHWLFGIPFENIEVVIHPESIIHSMVEFVDGATIAELSNPDMKIPIQYALFHPERLVSNYEPLKLTELNKLTFYSPTKDKYPLLDFIIDIGKKSGNLPSAIVLADDIVVEAFLRDKIKFGDIATILKRTIDSIKYIQNPTINEIINTMKDSSIIAKKLVDSFSNK